MTPSLRHLFVVFALLLVPGVARADPADDAMDAGERAFNNKDYAKARAEFQKSYDMRPDPLAIFNIAQAYRFEGNAKQAIEFYKKYIAESAAAADLRAKAGDYVAQLEDAERKADEERRRKAEAGPKDPDGNPAAIGIPPKTTPTMPVDAHPSPKRTIPLGTKIAAGVGGAALVGALVVTKLGLSAESDLEELRAMSRATAKDSERVERYQNLINVSWVATGAAALTAVAIYFAAPSYVTDRKSVAINPTRNGFSASFTTRF